MFEVPTEKLALKIWWAMIWRTLPLVLIASIVSGFILGLIANVMRADPESIQAPAALAGALIGLYISVQVIKYLMTKGFGEYRLVVVKK